MLPGYAEYLRPLLLACAANTSSYSLCMSPISHSPDPSSQPRWSSHRYSPRWGVYFPLRTGVYMGGVGCQNLREQRSHMWTSPTQVASQMRSLISTVGFSNGQAWEESGVWSIRGVSLDAALAWSMGLLSSLTLHGCHSCYIASCCHSLLATCLSSNGLNTPAASRRVASRCRGWGQARQQ